MILLGLGCTGIACRWKRFRTWRFRRRAGRVCTAPTRWGAWCNLFHGRRSRAEFLWILLTGVKIRRTFRCGRADKKENGNRALAAEDLIRTGTFRRRKQSGVLWTCELGRETGRPM